VGSAPVTRDAVVLIDSGGQYLDGTTDVTRTVSGEYIIVVGVGGGGVLIVIGIGIGVMPQSALLGKPPFALFQWDRCILVLLPQKR